MVLAGNPPAEPIHRAKSSAAGPLRDFSTAPLAYMKAMTDSDNAAQQVPSKIIRNAFLTPETLRP
jgi:hypothetical protein